MNCSAHQLAQRWAPLDAQIVARRSREHRVAAFYILYSLPLKIFGMKMSNFFNMCECWDVYKHTDYFRLEDGVNLIKDRDVYFQILLMWKKHLRSAMITYAELKKQHDFKVQHHRKTHLTEKIKCTCGKLISRGNILKHKNTKAHLQKVN